MLVPMRMELEGLSARDAVDAVLRENLHGLELDPRCVEVAVFALALAAWTYAGAEGYRLLPEMNLACSGLAPNATKEQWSALSEQAAAAGGLAPGRDLFGVDDTLLSAPLRNSMETLYELFSQAPVLGSLIDPHALEADLFQRDFESIRELFTVVLEHERASDDQIEQAVAARGMARAAQLLSGRYTLVTTNVPYLTRVKQGQTLRSFSQRHYVSAKNELATVFLERCLRLCAAGGTVSLVLPQNWLFLPSYRKLREKLLQTVSWHLLARLGSGAFETITGEVVKTILLTMSPIDTANRYNALLNKLETARAMYGLDVAESRTVDEKAEHLVEAAMNSVEQARQLENPDSRVLLHALRHATRLTEFADSYLGLGTGDFYQFGRRIWEFPRRFGNWSFLQSSAQNAQEYDGLSLLVAWNRVQSRVHGMDEGQRQRIHNQDKSGRQAWNTIGIAVALMQNLRVSIYLGGQYDKSMAVIVPKDPQHTLATFAFCRSSDFALHVREIDQKVIVANGTLTKVPFVLDHWQRAATKRYPNGLPRPYSNDPTQWIFHGHPCGSVIWDETEKLTAHGPLRTDPTVLHVAVARLLGYRWPTEHDVGMELADEQREWVRRTEALLEWMDEDGIVCIPPVRGEPPARDRLLGLLASAFGDVWNDGVLARLLGSVDSRSLDGWLRDGFFEEHCKLFHHRPFVWHIWDGRRRDGFHALVNYHKLTAGDGRGRQLLESLTYSYLNDWIARQRDGAQRREEGAEDRLAAACELQKRLEAILEGEPPYDIFVRWKPTHEQPIGWGPDINDGVRLNIRPFMAEDIPGGKKGAGVLRTKPKISWKKDRGKEVLKPAKRSKPSWLQDEDEFTDLNEGRELRPREDYPWFWTCPGDGPRAERTNFPGGSRFDGNRWNDLHYTNATKSAARERKREQTATPNLTRELADSGHLFATSTQSAIGRSDR